MHFSTAEITAWLGGYAWPFIRIGAMIAAMPLFGTSFMPSRVRLHLALGITVLVAPLLPPMPAVDALGPEALLITFHQIAIGVFTGFIFQVVFAAFIVGGQTMAMQMGLGFASMVDPVAGGNTPVLGMIYTLMISMLFLAFDGHLVLFELLAKSFQTLPVGFYSLDKSGLWTVAIWSGTMFEGAVRIAMPLLASLLVVNLAFGVVTKAAPQFNIFAVGMPIFILGGLVIMAITLPTVLPHFSSMLHDGFELVRKLFALDEPGGG